MAYFTSEVLDFNFETADVPSQRKERRQAIRAKRQGQLALAHTVEGQEIPTRTLPGVGDWALFTRTFHYDEAEFIKGRPTGKRVQKTTTRTYRGFVEQSPADSSSHEVITDYTGKPLYTLPRAAIYVLNQVTQLEADGEIMYDAKPDVILIEGSSDFTIEQFEASGAEDPEPVIDLDQ